MSTVTTKDGVEIFYKDWGKGQPIVFSHGWPLSADDWDAQLLFFLGKGYRVIAHDRRGHGRSSQVGDGHDMDHYADDLAAVTGQLELQNAIHVGHSTGGGEVVRYLARHGENRVAKAAIISAVPPLMVRTDANPGGLPKEVFDDFQAQLATNRSEFYRAVAAGPFYNYNRPGAKPSEAIIQNWWRQGMMGGAKAHYDGIFRAGFRIPGVYGRLQERGARPHMGPGSRDQPCFSASLTSRAGQLSPAGMTRTFTPPPTSVCEATSSSAIATVRSVSGFQASVRSRSPGNTCH
ncbi:pimeloyl-ACP methyl ester carboxylesterase [Bradyrhizobium japonicum]|uniref:alpha/beta fold hydrolase n=1 Tax=Bradyrhizobium japonicum TaxID=375 RepID=UPI003398E8DC